MTYRELAERLAQRLWHDTGRNYDWRGTVDRIEQAFEFVRLRADAEAKAADAVARGPRDGQN